MHIRTIAIIMLASVFLAACAQEMTVSDEEQPQVQEEIPDEDSERIVCTADVMECPDGSYVSRDPDNNCEFMACPEVDETETTDSEVDSEFAATIDEFREAIARIASYEFTDTRSRYTVKNRGDLSLVYLNDPNEFSLPIIVNMVYLDHAAEQAFAACVRDRDAAFDCPQDSRNKYMEIPYGMIEVPDPFSYVDGLTQGVLAGTERCDNRDCVIIRYEEDGKEYRMIVRTVFPMPYEIAELDDEGRRGDRRRFEGAAFNHLSVSDVTMPDLTLVEE